MTNYQHFTTNSHSSGVISPSIKVGNPLQLTRRQAIYHVGDQAKSLFHVSQGLIRITRTTPEGRLLTVRHVVPGDYFGEEALHNDNRTEVAEALTLTSVDIIEPANITYHNMLAITTSLSRQLQRLMNYEYHLQTGDLRERVARYLINLAQTPLATVNDAGHVTISATHELIAEGTGSTRESVSKIITDLRLQRLIDSGYRNIIILEQRQLQKVASGT